MLTVIGGTYFEHRKDTNKTELWGSGLRGACALVDHEKISFISCIGKEDVAKGEFQCAGFGVDATFHEIPTTVTFIYDHPLKLETFRPYNVYKNPIQLDRISCTNALYYGMIEAEIALDGDYVVYDPQNGKSFKSTGSTAKHLAIVLNRSEAYETSGIDDSVDLESVGRQIMHEEKAEVLIIKNGVHGALVFANGKISRVPIYQADKINSIGSGDIFSASFAWKWIAEKMQAHEAAMLASQYTAQYCNDRQLPLTKDPLNTSEVSLKENRKKVYLAGPFFSISEKYQIEEVRSLLLRLDVDVFSPLHDVGLEGDPKSIATLDLKGLNSCDSVLAIVDGEDPGTLFEIGYARAMNKDVVVLSTNVKNDTFMLSGTDCMIINDLTTAIYKSAW